jgi:hypothetical protein
LKRYERFLLAIEVQRTNLFMKAGLQAFGTFH